MSQQTRINAPRRLVVVTVALLLLGGMAPTAAGAAPKNARDDRLNGDRTAWTYVYDHNVAQLGAHMATTGHRLVSVSVRTASPLTVDAVMVANSGAHATGWWWYPELSQADIESELSKNNARLTQLVPYQTAQGRRFFAVMISNTGAFASAWLYYIDADRSVMSPWKGTYLPLAIEGRTAIHGCSSGSCTSGYKYETLIAIANPEGLDHHVEDALFEVEPLEPYAGSRIIDVGLSGFGAPHLGYVRAESTDASTRASAFYRDVTTAELAAKVKQDDVRLIDLVRYRSSDGRELVAAAAVSNADPLDAALRQPPLDTGRSTAVLRPAGSPTSVLSANPNLGVEPASAIKVLHVLHALREVQLGLDSLDAPFVYYRYTSNFAPGSKDSCPVPSQEIPANEVTTTLREALAMTLKASDNRTTRGLELRYGRTAINATAAVAGLSRTRINSLVGCFNRDAPNTFSAADAAALHAGIHNGTLLSGAARTAFYEAILTNAPGGALLEMINEEGARLGLSKSVVNTFAAATSISAKGGAYGSGADHTRSDAGRIVLPVNGAKGATRTWTYALLIDSIELTNCCTTFDNARGAALANLIRPAVQDALATYVGAAPKPLTGPSSPSPMLTPGTTPTQRTIPAPTPTSRTIVPARGASAPNRAPATASPTPSTTPRNLLDCVGRLLKLNVQC